MVNTLGRGGVQLSALAVVGAGALLLTDVLSQGESRWRAGGARAAGPVAAAVPTAADSGGERGYVPLRSSEPDGAATASAAPRVEGGAAGGGDRLALLEQKLDAALAAFDARLAALELGAGMPGAIPGGPASASGASSAPVLAAGATGSPFAALEARIAGLEARIGEAEQSAAKRVRRAERRLRKLEGRFGRAETAIQISSLSVDEQVRLATHSPLGRELLKKVAELTEKLDGLMSERVVEGTSYQNLIPGLWGTYYKDKYFTERAGTRIDAQLDFDWGTTAPEPLEGKGDQFSIRWEGVLRVPVAGKYSLTVLSDDGIRVWVGEQLVVAEYSDHAPREDLVDLPLEVGDYPLRVEFYENGGLAVARLFWQLDGGERAPIPAECLYHTLDQERY